MRRRIDTALRVAVPLLLALAIATPAVAGPLCAPSPTLRDCAEICSDRGYMSIDCAREMADGGECGDMQAPGPTRERDQVSASSTQQAPVAAALEPAESLPFARGRAELSSGAGRADLPPLDPLGVRIRI